MGVMYFRSSSSTTQAFPATLVLPIRIPKRTQLATIMGGWLLLREEKFKKHGFLGPYLIFHY